MKQITVDELKARFNKGEHVNLLDVREDHERSEFNIGGVHHKLGLIQNMQTEQIDDWRDDEVIVYCRSGNRSGQAALLLETMGFKNVVNLAGGMLAWQEKYGSS